MAASMDIRGLRNRSTIKLTKSIYEAHFLAVGSKTGSACHDAHMQRARWERTPARGPLWLLPSGPDQVRGVTPPAPVERANRLILANPFPRDEAAQTAHQKRERSRADSLLSYIPLSYIYVGSAQSRPSSIRLGHACVSLVLSPSLIPANLETVGTAGIFVAKAYVSSALSGNSTEADASAM